MKRLILYGAITALVGLWSCTPEPIEQPSGFIIDGLKVVFYPIPGSGTVDAGFYLEGGANYMGRSQAGIESFLFEVAIRATESRPAVLSSLEVTGSRLEVVTHRDYTGLTISFPSDELEIAWDLYTDVLLNPRLDPADIEYVRARRLAAIAQVEADPRDHVAKVANAFYYNRHAYAVDQTGTRRAIADLKRQLLLQYLRGDVTKDRAVLVIVGDITLNQVTSRVRILASKMSNGPGVLLPGSNFEPTNPNMKMTRRSLPANYIYGMFLAPKVGHPEYPALLAAMEIFRTRLDEELRQTDAAYDLEVGVGTRKANYAYLSLSTTRALRAINAINSVLERLVNDPLSPEELARAAAAVSIRHLRASDSTVGLRDQLAIWELIGEGWEQWETFSLEMSSQRVGNVQAIINKYFKNFHYAIVGDGRGVNSRDFKRW